MSGQTSEPASGVGAGLGLMTLAMLLVPVMDVIAKLLGKDIPPLEITFVRFLLQALLSLIFGLVFLRGNLLPDRLGLHMVRGLCLSFATLCFFAALKTMPLANTLAVFFVEPIILTGLSALILREQVGARRWLASCVGFAGAVLIIRPSWAQFGATSLLPLAAAFLFACYLLLTRHLSNTGPTLAMHFAAGFAGALALGLALGATSLLGLEGAVAVWPDAGQAGQMLVIGVIGFVSHYLVIMAFARAPASVLAPLNYLEIVSATTLGYLVFKEFPDAMTWAGIGLIILSGLYITHRESLRARKPKPAYPPEM